MKKYFIITYGCQMNVSDSEKIAGLLEKQGYQKARNAKSANLVVINICSVRQSAMDRVYSKIKDFAKLKTQNSKLKIILVGCLLEADKKKLHDQVDEIWSPAKYFGLASCRQNKKSAYVPIMTGCDNFCSYCVVPYTRGREVSRPAAEIIREVKSLVKNGYEEILLIGQNVNSYKSKIQNPKSEKNSKFQIPNSKFLMINFAKLLNIINDIPGNFEVSFLTSHPKDMSDDLVEAMAKCRKVRKEIHLPVQSGDNEILRKMNRGYTTWHYKNLIKKIRQKIPNVLISTDVIVGFPGETKKQFQNTVKLFKEIKFNKAYIAKYSPRPGTAAAKLKNNVSNQEKKERWKILNNLVNIK